MGEISRVLVLGLGKVGELVARLLDRSGFEVVGADLVSRGGIDPFPTVALDVTDAAAVRERLAGCHAVVSCLPFRFNRTVAEAAVALGVHYFDLTEDVATTQDLLVLAARAESAVMPQCGLAPGLICMTGAWLARGLDRVESIELKVGALPASPSGLLGYAFNWSPEGVVNEYLNECEVIRDGRRRLVPAMSETEMVWIAGTRLEAFTTSGGLGTMCATFEGHVERLDYKTLRYPGHCELMRFFFDELHLRQDRDLAGRILVKAKPPVDDDVVYLYAAVEGERGGVQVREQVVRTYRPVTLAGRRWRAISWTTAASVCAAVEMVAGGELPQRGFVRQEDVDLDALMATPTGKIFADPSPVAA
ncbi:MAG: saccharopine dehydrogenase NADP-binding domain-containing protein [Actinomycetota bacterium]|nr:saccharopine dehydrogenase NADP-binding domain-containing protein [Actinomycetota bacterium]